MSGEMEKLPIVTGLGVMMSAMVFGATAKSYAATRHPVSGLLAAASLVGGMSLIVSSIDWTQGQTPPLRPEGTTSSGRE